MNNNNNNNNNNKTIMMMMIIIIIIYNMIQLLISNGITTNVWPSTKILQDPKAWPNNSKSENV